ncbi:Hsp20 family protein, partial [Klebsiella pneumoniae]|nr:Hsp20 family protein [Klebsiella pneumoniae]
DLHAFDPSEISVKFEDDRLQVHGKREVKSDDDHKYEFREYTQHFKVPDSVLVEKLHCKMDKSGFLQIEAPVKEPQIE